MSGLVEAIAAQDRDNGATHGDAEDPFALYRRGLRVMVRRTSGLVAEFRRLNCTELLAQLPVSPLRSEVAATKASSAPSSASLTTTDTDTTD